MLGFAELIVILSGRGGIDLSVGRQRLAAPGWSSASPTASGAGRCGWPSCWPCSVGGVLGAVNGFLVAYIGFPALIATLATYYAYKSLAVVINNQRPISTNPIQNLYDATAESVSCR